MRELDSCLTSSSIFILVKLNALLAKSDHGQSIWKNLISGYIGFFKSKQGAFKGEKKTYTPAEQTIDEPARRGNTLVITTVGEKLDYLEDTLGDYINNLLSIEATNASGTAKTRLKVGDEDFGELSSIELMRLKGLLEELKPVYEEIPVRADNEIWNKTSNTDYANREGIYEGPQMDYTNKGTLKETYIVIDPNVTNLKDTTKYTPVTATKDTVVTYGQGSHQKFSGEWTQRERALLLDRRSKLLEAVIVALKQCNEADQIPSDLTAIQLFSYLHVTPAA